MKLRIQKYYNKNSQFKIYSAQNQSKIKWNLMPEISQANRGRFNECKFILSREKHFEELNINSLYYEGFFRESFGHELTATQDFAYLNLLRQMKINQEH